MITKTRLQQLETWLQALAAVNTPPEAVAVMLFSESAETKAAAVERYKQIMKGHEDDE